MQSPLHDPLFLSEKKIPSAKQQCKVSFLHWFVSKPPGKPKLVVRPTHHRAKEEAPLWDTTAVFKTTIEPE